MFVAATTDCFPHLSLVDALEKLVDLEFTNIEIDISESSEHLKPSEVADDLNYAVGVCTDTRRLDLVSYGVDIQATGDEYYRQFEAICRLAKATKVVILSVRSDELGTPFNEEVERFKKLVEIGELQGVRVGIRSEAGRLSEDPDTVSVICDHVKGLGLSFDPSHYIYSQKEPRNTDKLIKYVQHVYLRDSTEDELQVRVGQGLIDYGKIFTQLQKSGYVRALCVHIKPQDGVDHMAELRKMRLLLESLQI